MTLFNPKRGLVGSQDNIRYGDIYARHGPEIGYANLIRYDVRLQTSGGNTVYPNVIPNHRRPSDDTEIRAADVGDIVVVMFQSGNQPKFLIHEGLATRECELNAR